MKILISLLLFFIVQKTCCEEISVVLTRPFYSIGTASISGTYFPLGLALSRLINSKIPELTTLVEPTKGSIENVKYLQQNDVSFALVQSDIVSEAYNGRGIYEKNPCQNLKVMISLYPEIIHIAVAESSEIFRIEDLFEKVVIPGARGSGSAANAEFLLNFCGIKCQFHFYDLTRAADALLSGNADALFWTGGIPGEALSELSRKMKLRFLSLPVETIEKIIEKYPFFSREEISEKVYGQSEKVNSLALRAVLVSSVKTDEKTVESIMNVIFQNTEYLKTLHPRAADIRLKDALKGVSPDMLHPGAVKFFEKKGLLGVR